MNLIFNSTQDVMAIVPISADVSFTKLRSYLLTAQSFVERYIGSSLMTIVASSPSANAGLAQLIRVPVANLALMKYLGTNAAQITDMGLLRNVSETQKDAFEWQHNLVATNLQSQAWDGLEALLQHIENNLSLFPDYTSSAQYQQNRTYLIQSATVFDSFYPISGSRLVFSTLQPALREAEVRRIRPVLGLRHAELLADSLTPAQTTLLEVARRALVYTTMGIALRQRMVDVTDQGVQVRGISQFSAIKYEQPADEKRLQNSLQFFDQEAAELLDQMAGLVRPTPRPTRGSRVQGGAIVAF